MFAKAILLWIVGLVTFVPYGTYYLLFEAPRDQYALLITAIAFWIFGYWSLIGPIIMAVKVRRVFRAIESAGSREQLERALKSPDARDVAIDLIASENHIPRFLASRVYELAVSRLARRARSGF
jgi:hypothetical protein